MSRYFISFSLFMGVEFSDLHSQELSPIQTDRPDQTETPFTVPKDHFQMENGFLAERTDRDNIYFTYPSILFKFGLSDHFEIGMITEFAAAAGDRTISGLNPVTFRFKEKITDEKGIIPTTSFIGYLGVPYFATKNFKSTYFTPAFRFTMQHTLTEKLSLGYNLGAQFDGETPAPTFVYTLTTGYAITEKIGSYIEVYGFIPQFGKQDHRFDGGFNYLMRSNVLFDISAGVGLTENAPDYYTALGFSFRLKD